MNLDDVESTGCTGLLFSDVKKLAEVDDVESCEF